MARSRNIKPGFFKNEDLAECTPWARICFAGLWTLADREGRLEDRPKRIKGELFALDSVEVEPLLQELARFNFVFRYGDGARRFLQITNFRKHQNPHHKEAPSAIPSPQSLGLLPHEDGGETEASTHLHEDQASDKPGASPSLTGHEPAEHAAGTVLIPDSLLLIPDSLSPSPSASGGVPLPEGFEEFWSVYPKKVAKTSAVKAFSKLKVGSALLRTMVDAVLRQRESVQWKSDGGKFIPHPATWLSSGRWMDESSGPEPVDGDRPAWATKAGFANRFEAENAGCFEHNAMQFSDGLLRKDKSI